MSERVGSRLRVVWLCVLLHLSIALSAQGQASVLVVDGNGRPVPAVRVDAYGLAELLEVAASSADGWATLTTGRWPEVRRLSLSHLGFQTLIVQASELPVDGILRLEPRPVGIEGIQVEARGDYCPVNDDPEARRLWAEVATRYSPDTGTRAMSGTFLFDAGPVRSTELYRVEESRLAPDSDGRSAEVWRPIDRTMGPIESFVARDGYSWTPARLRFGTRDLHRVYPEFDVWHAYHFATVVFGELHDFAVFSERDGVTTLAFCPNGRGSGTSIQGLIELLPAERFLTAEWRFQTDDPDEDAGGEVTFVPPSEGRMRMPHLLAARGIFFRHNGKRAPYPDLPRTYYREVHARIEWAVRRPSEPR